MSHAEAPSSRPSPVDGSPLRQRRGCRRTALILLLLAVAVVPLLLMWASFASQVVGTEFSPDTFQTRQFRYSRIPWTGMILSGRTVIDTTPEALQVLVSDGWIPMPGQSPPRWHLISDSRQPESSGDFDAALLLRYLNLRNEGGNSFWPDWSERHSEEATSFWSLITRLAREERYLLMPPLFRLAFESDDDAALQAEFPWRLHLVAASEAGLLARIEEESGNAAEAASLRAFVEEQIRLGESFRPEGSRASPAGQEGGR